MQRRDEIDSAIGGPVSGLSALAMLSLVLCHYDMGVPGGFTGIDVFFVVAGFLIASSLRAELSAGSFTFLSFYEQGARRILPALFVMLAVVLGAGIFLLQPPEFNRLGGSGAFASLFASNFYYFLESNFFPPRTQDLPVLHTWAVAVVEQVYIFLPLAIVALRKTWPAVILLAIAGMAAVSFVFGLWFLNKSQSGGFYLMPARAWELLAGALLAYAPRLKLHPLLAGAIGLGGIAAIIMADATYDVQMFFPGKRALMPVIGAMAVIYSSMSGGFVAKALAWRPVAFVGKVSYSWFIWHWPLIAFYKYLGFDDGSLWPKLLLLALSFVLGVMSWRFIERPFRERRTERSAFGPLLAALCLSIAAADIFGFAAVTRAMPGRENGPVLALQKAHQD